jgi:glycine hydroxymethyltransferase
MRALQPPSLPEIGLAGLESLLSEDPALAGLLRAEHERQNETLSLVASSSLAHPSVHAAQAIGTDNLTIEGQPEARFHAGARIADQIEELACHRARQAFGAPAAFVQPHSGTSANYLTVLSLCAPGQSVLSLSLRDGGHLSHGAEVGLLGRYYDVYHYGLTRDHRIDYDQVSDLAKKYRPALIIAGASSYPRVIDFAAFRIIADEVGAWLLADMSHIAGLVAAGLHPSPVETAHIVTTSTYKQLGGPRGGLILVGKNTADRRAPSGKTLSRHLETAVFPFFQGTPSIGSIAAKARALELVRTPRFATVAKEILDSARALAEELGRLGYRLVSGGTDNHIVLIDLREHNITGAEAQDRLESCSILVNKNLLPDDPLPATKTSGLRLGSNTLAFRGMQAKHAVTAAEIIDAVLINPTSETFAKTRHTVANLCAEFPIDGPNSWARP